MTCWWNFLTLVGYLSFVAVLSNADCPPGYNLDNGQCFDFDECEPDEDYPDLAGPCGDNKVCHNTIGSFICKCADGYRSSTLSESFSAEESVKCDDIDECSENGHMDLCGPNAKCFNTAPNYSCICRDGFISHTGVERFHHGDNVTCIDTDECKEDNICGQNATCFNTIGSYYCVCDRGFGLKSGKSNYTGIGEQCEDLCSIDKTICGNGTCHPGVNGHLCECHKGFTNYGNKLAKCTAFNCDDFNLINLKEGLPEAHDFVVMLKKHCQGRAESVHPDGKVSELDGYGILESLFSIIDKFLSTGVFSFNTEVSSFLHMVENTLRFIGPLIKPHGTNRSSHHTELNLLTHHGNLPHGPVTLSSTNATLHIQLEMVAGSPSSYPGFAAVSMLSYTNMEKCADGFFTGMKMQQGQRYKINSKVVTVTVSNRNTSHLSNPVTLTFHHLSQSNECNHTCVFWNSSMNGGTWSPSGCNVVESNAERTVCSCNHLSSFAVLMALHDIEDKFELQLITWVGLSLSLFCLFLCILTFSLIRSIKSPRTTIHLHLCISLFIAIFIFLTCISRTENKVGCAVVAGLLHFFFLAAFCWMCLEGIQLFRMVVLVFNTSFKTLYMMIGGYGVPAVIVGISAAVNAKGYGTERHCWLHLDLIWSFFGPACVIIVINIFFFLITVWKLAQKFTSLNPDLDKLQKIKAFTITAVAQLCVLGTMWIFGCFQFEESAMIMSYLFTIFGSLQGVMMFVFHCLLPKQVREEYVNILSRLCAPSKKTYSEFSTLSSKREASKSTQDTGESHI